jgi:hypothetical protein
MRTVTLTEKCRTNFGNIFVHVDMMPDGRVMSIAFSQPGKLDNSTIGNALDALSARLNAMIALRSEPIDGKGQSE